MSVLETLSGRGSPAQADADPQTIADVLASERRCFIIDALNAETPRTLNTLADKLAAHEHGPEYSANQRKAAYVTIYQNHFPVLADVGAVVDHDGRRHVLDRGPAFDGFAAALDALRAHSGGDAE